MKKLIAVLASSVACAVVLGAAFGSLSQSNKEPLVAPIARTQVSWAETFNNLDELFARADVVARVKVEKLPQDLAAWDYPVVETIVRVEEGFKGKFKMGDEVIIHQPGSARAENPELPFLDAETSYIVFLTQQFAGQPQHYILGPDALYSLNSQGSAIRASSLGSLVDLDVEISKLRNMDPIRRLEIPQTEEFSSVADLQLNTPNVVVVQVYSDAVQVEAQKNSYC